jgi:uncharacterized protein with von Willebrand factor type A (vWA) domain
MRRHHVETDSIDRQIFARLCAESEELARLGEEGSRLLPHFSALLRDLFASLYKLNRVRFPADEMRPSVRIHAMILDGLERSEALRELRLRTELDEARAGLGAVLLAERLLRWLRRSRGFTEQELIESFDAAEKEAEREAERRAEAEARRLSEEAEGEEGRRAFEAEAERRASRVGQLERALQSAARSAERAVEAVPTEARRRLERQLARAPEQLDELETQLDQWQLGVEGEPGEEASRRIDLGRRLASNPKLIRLAALVGRFREQARSLRQARTPRRSSEVFSVDMGSELGHLLPEELVRLRHPAARLDLLRRLLEGRAGVYSLRGLDRHGRGPMIVCLDCSSSMTGAKELWSKAVALTLLEIARRQRRAFEVIAFTGAEAPLAHFPLLRTRGDDPERAGVLALAEHFPGGGTSFEKPLAAALERAQEPRARGRADVVLISDGESSISDAFAARLESARRQDEIGILTVLIDVGTSSLETVKRFSDRVTSVKRLSDESASEIFLELD